MRRFLPVWILDSDESLFDVVMDAGISATLAMVATESLRCFVDSL